jgi:hypothetical protein
MLPRQVLYHISHSPFPFLFGYFSDRGACFCLGGCGWQSCVTGITGAPIDPLLREEEMTLRGTSGVFNFTQAQGWSG